ncbi:MAG: leucine-rich repeat domain-containing protein [Oscillospiraceae bacterium]|nr:leucine-rich repeat domain-containing protein [Oscillospiraceae bacterium]
MLKKLIILIFLLIFFGVSVSAEEYEAYTYTDDGIGYSVDGDGFVTVEGIARLVNKIVIPDEIYGYPVKYIRETACLNNVDLEEIIISDIVESIGAEAFQGCINLRSVKLPANLERIEKGTFAGCVMLKDIILPETLNFIDDFAFEGCLRLGELKIPASVGFIGHDVFMTCESLILDCSENSYAADYAERNNIVMNFKSSGYYPLFIAAIITVVLGVAVISAFHIVKKVRKPLDKK